MNKIKIQEISNQGCSHCAAAKEILEELKSEFPQIEVQYIDMISEQGQKMVAEYGIMSAPGIIVNDKLFSIGGLDKKKLVKKIQEG